MRKLPSLSLHRLQNRILASVLILVVAIQAAAFVLINTVGAAAVRQTVIADVATAHPFIALFHAS